MERESLERLLTERTVAQLRDLARGLGLKGYSRLDKGGLIALLLEKAAPGFLEERLLPAENRMTPGQENPEPPTEPPTPTESTAPTASAAAAAFTTSTATAASPTPSMPAAAAKKEKRLSKLTIWASILGFGIGVIALVVTFISSSSSEK